MDWTTYREEFEPPRRGLIYLNHAGTSPIPQRCAEVMKRVVDLSRALTPEDGREIRERLDRCRQSLAALLHVGADEIAFTRNTTAGINWVAGGMDGYPNDRIVRRFRDRVRKRKRSSES